MNREFQEKIETLFHDALALPQAQREAFLQNECNGDENALTEVESLLKSFDSRENFLDEPLFELGLNALGEKRKDSFANSEIGFYKVQEKIGEGGMGEVYRAIDTRLSRRVALKFLSDSLADNNTAKRQFRREAQAAAALEHPNICAVHGIEQTDEHNFIVMQFVEGITLAESIERGEKVNAEEFKSLARQILNAAAFAHSHDIIHRDLKPGNIMLTGDGQIKILDFGLAKVLAKNKFFENSPDNKSLYSSRDILVGTIAYMSPEQLCGKKADYRSDIFALGVIFYELLTGKSPFSRESKAETMSAILNESPASLTDAVPDIPENICALVEKCLEKDAEKRFQSVAEILIELDNTESVNYQKSNSKAQLQFFLKTAFALFVLIAMLAVGYFFYLGKSSRRTLAILPITIEQGLSDKEYLADGLTQSIIEKLSNLSDLDVKNEALITRYKEISIEPREAGKELNVDAVFAGTLKVRADGLFLESKIIRISDGIFIDKNDAKIDEKMLIGLSEEVAARILNKINSQLTAEDQDKLVKKDTDSAQAKNFYLQGRYHLKRRTQSDDVEKSVQYFFNAKEIDPKYAKAWAGLADAYIALSATGVKGAMLPEESIKLAKTAAQKALELDNTMSESYNSLGLIALKYEWKWAESETYYKMAIARDKEFLSPRFGLINLLRLQKRFDEALQEVNEVKKIDPFSIRADIEIALISYNKNDYEAMDNILSELLTKFPENMNVKYVRAYQFLKTNRFKEAVELLEPFYVSDKEEDKILVAAPLGFAYAKMGRRTDALKIIQDLDKFSKKGFVPAQEKSLIYVALGDYDKVFEFLNHSCAEKFASLPGWTNDPIVEEVWSDGRFAKIKQCVNL